MSTLRWLVLSAAVVALGLSVGALAGANAQMVLLSCRTRAWAARRAVKAGDAEVRIVDRPIEVV